MVEELVMGKTPEELAKEFSKFNDVIDIGTDLGSYRQGLFEGFLAGFNAGFDHSENVRKMMKAKWQEMYLQLINIENNLPK